MKKNLVAGLLVGTMAVGAVAITFNGEQTLRDTQNHLATLTQDLNLFKSNESKLVDAVTTLKVSKKELQEQIKVLEKSNADKQLEIDALNNQITALNNRIAELEELIANGGTSNEDLQNENNRLNAELEKANSEILKANNLVNDLQKALDKSMTDTKDIKPMSKSDLDNLVNDNLTPPSIDDNEDVGNVDYIIDLNNDSYNFEDLNISIMGNTWIFEGVAQYPVVIHLEDGSTMNANANDLITVDKKVVKVTYKTASGTSKVIQVNR